jgi:hypothetical protein
MYPALIPAARCPTNLHKQPNRAAMKARDESVQARHVLELGEGLECGLRAAIRASYPDLEHLHHAALIVRAILVSQRER